MRAAEICGLAGFAADPQQWVTFIDRVAEFGAQYSFGNQRLLMMQAAGRRTPRHRLSCDETASGSSWDIARLGTTYQVMSQAFDVPAYPFRVFLCYGRLELTKFHIPAVIKAEPANAMSNMLGLRSVTFAVDDIDNVVARLQARGAELIGEWVRYEDSCRLCYVRGPEGIIVALAEELR